MREGYWNKETKKQFFENVKIHRRNIEKEITADKTAGSLVPEVQSK